MKKILLFFFLLFFAFIPKTFSAGTQTVNGIPLEIIDFENVKGIRASFFTDYIFGTQAVYNESGSTSATSGIIAVGKYPIKSLGVKIGTITGEGTLTIHINEFIGTDTFSFATTLTYGTVTTDSIPIQEYCEYLSVDGKTSTGTITADVIGNFVYETK